MQPLPGPPVPINWSIVGIVVVVLATVVAAVFVVVDVLLLPFSESVMGECECGDRRSFWLLVVFDGDANAFSLLFPSSLTSELTFTESIAAVVVGTVDAVVAAVVVVVVESVLFVSRSTLSMLPFLNIRSSVIFAHFVRQ